MALIRFYQRTLSRLKPYPTCRFTPTCSAYALEAFETRGFLAGLVLTVWRILRCSPLSPCGYDPVPASGFHTMPMRWSKYDRPVSPASGTPEPEPPAPDDETASEAEDALPTAPEDPGEDRESLQNGRQRPDSEEPHP